MQSVPIFSICIKDIKEPKQNSQKSRAWEFPVLWSVLCGVGKCLEILATPRYSKNPRANRDISYDMKTNAWQSCSSSFFWFHLSAKLVENRTKKSHSQILIHFSFALSHHLQFRYFTFQIFHLPVVSLSWILHPRVYLKPCVTCQLPGADKFYR